MRILVSTSTFPVTLDDGIPRFVFDLSESISAHADVTVLAPGTPSAPRQASLGALDVRRFNYFWPQSLQRLTPSGGRGMSEKMRASWLAKIQVGFFLLRQAWKTRRLIRQLKIDVINAHWIVPQGLTAAWALGTKRKTKLLLHIHAGDVYLLRRVPFGRAIARYVVKRTDFIFADGSHVRDCLNELLGYPSNAQLQPMGVYPELFERALANVSMTNNYNDEFPDGYILFVGRFVEKKGTHYLLQALPKIREQYPGLGLVMVGSGPEEAELQKGIERLGLAEAVRLTGRKPHDEIAHLLHNCRVAAVPSVIDRYGETDGMPTVIVEAMSAGVRVVASAVDGIPDIIEHEHNGWLCREKDPDDLAEKILAALRDPTPSPITESAMQTSQRFSWPRVAREYFQCIQSLINSREEGAT